MINLDEIFFFDHYLTEHELRERILNYCHKYDLNLNETDYNEKELIIIEFTNIDGEKRKLFFQSYTNPRILKS